MTVETFGEVQSLIQGKDLLGRFGPVKTVRCYAIDGLLIDSGLSCFSREVWDFARANAVDKAVITHHHEDHSGNSADLKEKGVRVFGTEATGNMVKAGFARHFYQRLVWAPAPPTSLETVAPRMETKKYRFDIIPAPGHCDDQIILHEPDQGWLFTGDAFLAAKVKYFRRDEDFQKTLETLERVSRLSFHSVFCAHNPVPDGGPELIRQKLANLKELAEKVRDLHRQGYGDREITRRVLGREDPFLFPLSMGDFSKINLIRSILYGPVPRKA